MSTLLTEELRKTLPKLYVQDGSKDPIVHAKFFFPLSNWTWFVTEGEALENGDFLFFGYVIGFEREWGHFALRELEEAEVYGLKIESDLYFDPTPFSKCSL